MIYLVLIATYLLILNVVATIRLSKSELNEKTQKVFQTILIWILPLFGAIIVSMILNHHEPMELKKKNLLKSIVLFIFLVKIKIDNTTKEYKGHGKTATDEDIYHASFQGAAADL